MGRNGKPTRAKILEESKKLVLTNGFAGTTIDQILEMTGISKGAFFYHFKSKAELALGLMDDHIKEDLDELEYVLQETEHTEGDPLERLLNFIQLYLDMMKSLEKPYPGCLYASYTYEPIQFSEEIKKKISNSILLWRETLRKMLDEVLLKYDTRGDELDIESLSDHFVVILEGAFIVSKVLNQADIPAKQLGHLKNYLQLLFEPKK